MSVERAPYLDYSEITSYLESESEGSEIPLFIVKSNNVVDESDITPRNVLQFKSYRKFKQHFTIPDKESEYNSLPDTIKDVDAFIKDFFVENSMYATDKNYGLSVPYIYIVDIGNAPTVGSYLKALTVSEMKRKSTVVVFPNTEDVELMESVKTKLNEESRSGFLRIAYFGVSGQGELASKFSKGDIIVPITGVDDYSEIIEVYKNSTDGKFYANKEGSTYTNEITPKQTAIYLNIDNHNSNKDTYVYDGETFNPINVTRTKDVLLLETDANYKFIIPSTKQETGGNAESFDEYCNRMSFISEKINSSRVCLVDKQFFGKTIARICSTPYYVEPGYLPFMTIDLGNFRELSNDERDALFGSGLIFGEDDYTLSSPISRMCIGSSTAWGIEDHSLRTTDALIHARRNVDYQVRNILKILAPQLKRNETSVTLRHVQNQVNLYLDDELDKGTIMEYSVEIIESSYNPYKLLVKGKIVPVNSTLAIEFENTIGSPYAIASDYI